MAIFDLAFHPFAYITVAELAEYWRLRKRRVLAHIDAGEIEAIQLAPGIYRVRTSTALAFERRAAVRAARPPGTLVPWRQGGRSSTTPQVRPFTSNCEELSSVRSDDATRPAPVRNAQR
jgi:hypothetical protein